MPLMIAAAALLGWWLLALSVPGALLLGAVLAPTDPVLADDVQVGEPSDDPEGEDEVRLTLTAEAGLNDALAFPFVMAALLVGGATVASSWWEWAAWQLAGRCGIAVAAGAATGWLLALLAFRASRSELRLAQHSEVFLALTAISLSYGLTEVLHGYGFLAVFVTAVVFRRHEPHSEYQAMLHTFVSQVERLLTLVLLLALGYGCAQGLLRVTTPVVIGFALLVILVLRPVVAWLTLHRTPARSGSAPSRCSPATK
jgi:NhaP-type Na+/H+ or K+/H+ antiporter